MVKKHDELPLPIRRKFHQLRRLLRCRAFLNGMTTVAFFLGVVFWVDLFSDRFLQFPLFFRGTVLVASVFLFLFLLSKFLLIPFFASISDLHLAHLVEQEEPIFNESLITSIELHGRDHATDSEPFYGHFLSTTVNQSTHNIESFDVYRPNHLKPLFARTFFVFVFWGIIAVYCFYANETVQLWYTRNVLLSSENWPRLSRISIEGFGQHGVARVVKGETFSLTVRADSTAASVPSQVWVLLRKDQDGSYPTKTVVLDQFRLEMQNGIPYRTFHYTIPELLEPLALSIIAGDTRIDDLFLDVVPAPNIIKYELYCEYPAYQNRSAQFLHPVSRTRIPEGTSLTVSIDVNKPLATAKMMADSQPLTEMEKHEEGEGTKWTFFLNELRKNTFLRFELEDLDGIRNRQSLFLELDMQKDQPPLVSAQLHGVGPAITPFAVLPVWGEITDDYGLADIYFNLVTIPTSSGLTSSEKGTEQQVMQLIAHCPENCIQFPLKHFFDVSSLQLEPGDRLALSIEANDHYDLGDIKGQRGNSKTWQFEIVTPVRLQGTLQAHEITMRERLETLIDDVRRSQMLLQQLQPVQSAVQPEIVELILRDLVRLLRDVQKEKYELQGIQDGFQRIYEELEINRILTEEERERLANGIINPIKRLIGENFGELEQLFSQMKELVENEQGSIHLEQEQGFHLFMRLLEEISSLRDSILNRETFQDAVERLRDILKTQQSIRGETMKSRQDQLRSLTE